MGALLRCGSPDGAPRKLAGWKRDHWFERTHLEQRAAVASVGLIRLDARARGVKLAGETAGGEEECVWRRVFE